MENLPSMWGSSLMDERRDPFRAIARMRRDMDDLFENFMSNAAWDTDLPVMAASRFQPAFDLEEKDSHYLLSFDVPGMSKEDIKVEVRDNQLHLTGEKKQEREEKKGRRYESERYFGSFERWLTLPQNTKAEGVEARVENGILQIAIPKTEATKAKEIKVVEGKTGIFSRLLGHKDAKEHAA